MYHYQHQQSKKEALCKHQAPEASILPFPIYRSKNLPTHDRYSCRTMEFQGAILGAGFKYKVKQQLDSMART